MNRTKAAIRRAASAFVGIALLLSTAGCFGDRAAPADKSNDALKKEAETQKKLHDREVHNR